MSLDSMILDSMILVSMILVSMIMITTVSGVQTILTRRSFLRRFWKIWITRKKYAKYKKGGSRLRIHNACHEQVWRF